MEQEQTIGNGYSTVVTTKGDWDDFSLFLWGRAGGCDQVRGVENSTKVLFTRTANREEEQCYGCIPRAVGSCGETEPPGRFQMRNHPKGTGTILLGG